jgi:hypothetical protein
MATTNTAASHAETIYAITVDWSAVYLEAGADINLGIWRGKAVALQRLKEHVMREDERRVAAELALADTLARPRLAEGGRVKRSLPERILAADTEVCRLLANANEAKEAGQTKRAERLYAAAQKALDKYNVLTGKA